MLVENIDTTNMCSHLRHKLMDADGTPNAMNAAWAGQWDGDKIMISMGNHQTTVNLNTNPDFTIAFATTETMVAADFVGVVSRCM